MGRNFVPMLAPEPITDAEGMTRLGHACASAAWIALSVETNAMHAYRERVCLLALNVGGTLHVVDTLALKGRPFGLRPIEAPLSDPSRPLYVHGGEYLAAGMKRDFQIELAGLVDAQQAAVLLGRPRTGYRALVGELLGVGLPPALSLDWAGRPLPAGAVGHALDDVRYLPAILAPLLGAIRDKDLEDELDEAGREVAWTSPEVGRFEPDGFHRLRGAHRLDDRGLQILRAIWLWRDAKARALDLPPGRLMSNEVIVELARHLPEASSGLRNAQFHSRLVWGDRDELFRAVSQAIENPTPLPPRRDRPPPTAAAKRRSQALKAWRQEEAARRGVGLQGVLPKKALRYLEKQGFTSLDAIPGLGRRRRERYGGVLEELCALEE